MTATNVSGTGDADYTLARLYVCSAKRNGYCNPALDKLLLNARTSIDQAERTKLYDQAHRDRVQNFVMPPSGRPLFAKVTVSDN